MVSLGEKESVVAKFQTGVLEVPSSSKPEMGGQVIYDGIRNGTHKDEEILS